jgi:cytochrome c oxidase subunit 2
MNEAPREPNHIALSSGIWVVLGLVGLGIALLIGPHFVDWGLLPQVASARDHDVNSVLSIFTYASIVVFAMIVAYGGYAVFRWRSRGRPATDGVALTGNLRLQITWVVISVALAAFLYGYGLYFLNQAQAAPVGVALQNELQVNVNGEQWLWDYTYPGYGNATSTELYLPIGRVVNFTITSTDVQHSFWIPDMAIKQDAVPGEVTHISVTPNKLGNFVVRCAELCGIYHAYMNTPVHVVTEQQFEAWVAQQPQAQPSSSRAPGGTASAHDAIASRPSGA